MTDARHVEIGELTLGNDRPFTLIAGPCQIESRQHAFDMAGALKEASAAAGDLAAALEKKDRSAAGPTAPAHGLYLQSVRY